MFFLRASLFLHPPPSHELIIRPRGTPRISDISHTPPRTDGRTHLEPDVPCVERQTVAENVHLVRARTVRHDYKSGTLRTQNAKDYRLPVRTTRGLRFQWWRFPAPPPPPLAPPPPLPPPACRSRPTLWACRATRPCREPTE